MVEAWLSARALSDSKGDWTWEDLFDCLSPGSYEYAHLSSTVREGESVSIFSEVKTVARKLNNYSVDATGGAPWTDTQNFILTVPAAKRGILLGGMTNRDVNSTVVLDIKDSGAISIDRLLDEGAATGLKSYPEEAFFTGTSRILDAGESVSAYFGVAQGVAAYITVVVLEVSM